MVYLESPADILAQQLTGFFVGWPNPPSEERLLGLLQNSSYVVLAFDDETEKVVGLVTAISDGVCAYIPLLEVLPDYQGRGIGTDLMRRMLDKLSHLYMIDLLCDGELQPFYERLGMGRSRGMMIRNYARQSGK